MKQLTQIIIAFATFLFCNDVIAQRFISFSLQDSIQSVFSIEDSSQSRLVKDKVILDLQSEGYITSWLRFRHTVGDTSFYEVKLGRKYVWKGLAFSDHIPALITTDFSDSKLTEEGIVSAVDKVLSHFQDRGYPFATCYLDSIKVFGDSVSGKIVLNTNQYIAFDSLEIKGGSSVTHQTLSRLIEFSKGMPYNESYVTKLPSVLSSFPFLSVVRVPEVYFYKGKASLVLYLDAKKNNKFDGVVGLNPNENSSGLEVVGEVNIQLANVLRRAESISLNWEKIKENSQRFKARFDYPFLFGSRIGVGTKLNYFRQDTAFANLDFNLGLSYFIDNNQSFKLGWNSINSNSLVQSSGIDLPVSNSFSANYLSIGYKSEQYDYPLNPTRGGGVNFTINSGFKNIDKNTELVNSNYQDLEENTRQFRIDVELVKFVPLFKKATAMIKFASGNIIGENIFLNELYQLGGLNSLRGFNQQSLFASNYYFLTWEYRYLFDRNSSVFIFAEGGFYESNKVELYENGFPIGAGFGVNFATKSGVFTLTYALGKQDDNPVLVRNGKIHFGFISLF